MFPKSEGGKHSLAPKTGDVCEENSFPNPGLDCQVRSCQTLVHFTTYIFTI